MQRFIYDGQIFKMAIFRAFCQGDPTKELDNAVSSFVQNERFLEFTEATLDNPWVRVVLIGINKIPMVNNDLDNPIVKRFHANLHDIEADICSIDILAIDINKYNGFDLSNFMTLEVLKIVNNEIYNEFIPFRISAPNIRLIIKGINDLSYDEIR